MPFNGSGTFTIVNTFVPNTTILSAAVNQNFTDIATGLSDCLTRDGQAGMTAALKGVSGSVSAPGISFNADATAGLYLSSTGIVGLVAKSLGLLVNSSILQVASATVQAGGSSYAVGDTITLTGGTAINQAVLTVATLSGTAVATVTVSYPGNYTVSPSNPVSQGSTDGLGSAATFNLTFATQFTRSIVTNEAGAVPWQRLGASSFVSGLMALANGLDFVNGIGATNIASGLGLSAPPPGSSFKNLSIKVATNTTITVAADFVVTTNGTKFQTTAVSSTINMGTTGINALDTGTIAIDTFYAIWAVAKSDGTTGCVASASGTSPTMPAGYTYKSRIGWVQTIHGSAILYGTYQFGRVVTYVVNVAGGTPAPSVSPGPVAIGLTGTYSTTTPTLVAKTVVGSGKYVPTTATRIHLAVATNFAAGATANVQVAPSQSYGGSGNGPNGVNGLAWVFDTNGSPQTTSLWLTLETTTVSVAISNGTGGAVNCLGWEDNL